MGYFPPKFEFPSNIPLETITNVIIGRISIEIGSKDLIKTSLKRDVNLEELLCTKIYSLIHELDHRCLCFHSNDKISYLQAPWCTIQHFFNKNIWSLLNLRLEDNCFLGFSGVTQVWQSTGIVHHFNYLVTFPWGDIDISENNYTERNQAQKAILNWWKTLQEKWIMPGEYYYRQAKASFLRMQAT